MPVFIFFLIVFVSFPFFLFRAAYVHDKRVREKNAALAESARRAEIARGGL